MSRNPDGSHACGTTRGPRLRRRYAVSRSAETAATFMRSPVDESQASYGTALDSSRHGLHRSLVATERRTLSKTSRSSDWPGDGRLAQLTLAASRAVMAQRKTKF